MTDNAETPTMKSVVVEIHDAVGYTNERFDLEDLPDPLRRAIVAAPEARHWTYFDEEGGEWFAHHDDFPTTPQESLRA